MKKIFLFILFPLIVFGYIDSDLDGVEDKKDKCPNTSFMDLVDINGCSIKHLVVQDSSLNHFDVLVGFSYSDVNYKTLSQTDTYTTSLQIDYYLKNFSLQLKTSYYNSQDNNYTTNGLNDTFLGVSYLFAFLENISIVISGGVIFPTYDTDLKNNNIDYQTAINVNYKLKNFSIFGGAGYTFIQDDDVFLVNTAGNNESIEYQNSLFLNCGVGYYFDSSLYANIAYTYADSIYKGITPLQTIDLYGYYGYDAHWFCIFSYSKGVSKSAAKNYITFKLGYYF